MTAIAQCGNDDVAPAFCKPPAPFVLLACPDASVPVPLDPESEGTAVNDDSEAADRDDAAAADDDDASADVSDIDDNTEFANVVSTSEHKLNGNSQSTINYTYG